MSYRVFCDRCQCIYAERERLPGDLLTTTQHGEYLLAPHGTPDECKTQLRLGISECTQYIRDFSDRMKRLTEIHNGIVEENKAKRKIQ